MIIPRLLPLFSLKCDFLVNQIYSVMKIIDEVSGYVYCVMADNLSINKKLFEVYHQEYLSTSIYSINHLIDNMLPLYDMPHRFKNIRSNWVIDPTHTLEFVELDAQKTFIKLNGKTWQFTKVNATPPSHKPRSHLLLCILRILRSKRCNWAVTYLMRKLLQHSRKEIFWILLLLLKW